MSRRFSSSLLLALLPALLFAAPITWAAERVNFSRDIRPILSENCFACHGPDDKARKGKLRLDTPEGAFKRHDDKAAIVAGNAAQSEIIRRVLTVDVEDHMPPADSGKKSLSPHQVDLLKQWIAQGADYTGHWSFQPITSPAIPKIVSADVALSNPIDAFVLARLKQDGLKLSPPATREALIRRVTLDLIGLPPTLAEVDAFLADTAPNAYDQVVDRLLASPHFGEKMAIDWLDAARFADTHGYHIDSGRDMTRWREWVIEAFNRNLPFDQFTIWQIAGDLLPEATVEQKVASGFHRNHMINFEGGAVPEEYHAAYLMDRVNTTSTVWLGLTVACAQCHDHKYDPIRQRDYYQLYAFFHNVPEKGLDGNKGNAAPMLKSPTHIEQEKLDALAEKIKQLEQSLTAPDPAADEAQMEWEKSAAKASGKAPIPASVATALTKQSDQRTSAQCDELRKYYRANVSTIFRADAKTIAELQATQKEIETSIRTTMVMQEMPTPRDTYILMRGQYDKKGEKVTADVPAALPPLPKDAPRNRLGLARWLVAKDNPLTARVIVNRYWQSYFGTGIVKTAEDFGSQGEWPTHPELLDYLASQFMQSGWDVKAMQRLIVTSGAYRQSSRSTPEMIAHDPDNRLLSRGPRVRLSAELIRDQALAISGLLNGEIGGKSVSPYQPSGLWEELMSRADGKNWSAQTYTQSHGADLYRRTMYTFWKRTSPPPTLGTFDAPDRETCTVRRSRTNTPLQALVLLNDPTYIESSRKLAERILSEAAPATDQRLIFAFRLATARQPTLPELDVLRRAFEKQSATYRAAPELADKLLKVGEAPVDPKFDKSELAAWTMLSSIILNLDETITKG